MVSSSKTEPPRVAMVPRVKHDEARSVIDDAFLEELEKSLKLESPDHLLRQGLRMAVAHHLCVPPGGLASVARQGLEEARKYWDGVETYLSGFLELLPRENCFEEHPQAWRMRIELIDKAQDEERAIRELFEQRGLLEKWRMLGAKAQKALHSEQFGIGPNAKYGVDRILVSQLAGIFRERTGKDPRKHIRGNNAKNAYSGEFFEFAKSILRKVGNRQFNVALGDMIKKQLKQLRKVCEVEK